MRKNILTVLLTIISLAGTSSMLCAFQDPILINGRNSAGGVVSGKRFADNAALGRGMECVRMLESLSNYSGAIAASADSQVVDLCGEKSVNRIEMVDLTNDLEEQCKYEISEIKDNVATIQNYCFQAEDTRLKATPKIQDVRAAAALVLKRVDRILENEKKNKAHNVRELEEITRTLEGDIKLLERSSLLRKGSALL